jgi:integrase
VGNWLTAPEGEKLLSGFDPLSLRGKRDAAIVSLLLGCGLRRSEVVGLKVHAIQRREDHWAIVDLVGKGGRVGELEQIQFLLGHASVQTTERYIGKQDLSRPVNYRLPFSWDSGRP